MREHDIRTVLSEGGQTDVDEAIRRAAEELVKRHICTSYACNCYEYAQSVIHQHIAPVIAAKDAEIARLDALLLKQRKAWEGVCRIELDGPLVDFAEARIKEIAAREKGGAK